MAEVLAVIFQMALLGLEEAGGTGCFGQTKITELATKHGNS
jgi:hypothetical protein